MAEEPTIEQLQASISKLEENNKALKKERNNFKSVADKYSGVDLDALQAAAEKLSQIENDKLEADGEHKKLYDNLQTQYKTEVANLKQEKERVAAELETEIKVNALNNALASSKVDPVLLDIASKSLLSEVSLVEKKAVVGGKPVTDFVKEWAETEVGKRFIPSGNTGGGGQGNDGGKVQAEAKWFDSKSPEFNVTKQGQLRKTNPDLYDKLSKRYKNK